VRVQEPLETHEDDKGVLDDVSASNQLYLKSQLRYETGIPLDSSDNAVMMDWETHISEGILKLSFLLLDFAH